MYTLGGEVSAGVWEQGQIWRGHSPFFSFLAKLNWSV